MSLAIFIREHDKVFSAPLNATIGSWLANAANLLEADRNGS
jgi:hypothetical protein